MKLINIYQRIKLQLLAKVLPHSSTYVKMLVQLCFIASASLVIWFFGPLLTFQHITPFAPAEKRLYAIAFVVLIWLLKLLASDIQKRGPYPASDAETRKKLLALQNRLYGALQFLRKTTISKHGNLTNLNTLPWYLVIGPTGSGKTTLLANSKVNFILQRQAGFEPSHPIQSSETCDWWITRDATLIDVPGRYLNEKTTEKHGIHAALWRYLLRLIKQQCGKKGIAGIIITLPLPEIMRHGDPKKYTSQMRTLFMRLHDLQKQFPQPLPYYLVITKCDQLAGFAEFFADTTDEEIAQAWGINLPYAKNEKTELVFVDRFNALIKKLNQQLLWRLHQERNPMARPVIKDFPLQVERLKEFTLDFIQKLIQSKTKLALRGVYLTSAHQVTVETESQIIDAANHSTERGIQLFKEPLAASRAFFIKQFIAQGFAQPTDTPITTRKTTLDVWKKRSAYAASITIIAMAAAVFGGDFEKAIRQAYAIQHMLSNYQLAIQQSRDSTDHLEKTLALLNTLQLTANQAGPKLDVLHILTFYSQKSQQKTNEVYHYALKTVLLPEMKSYLADYLKNPVNKSAENVYGALKAYLMLGNTDQHFQADYIANTLRTIFPASLAENKASELKHHIQYALTTVWQPMALNNEDIQETRQYLTRLPSFQLGYIILKNINSNNKESQINLGTHHNAGIFTSNNAVSQIPNMFTAKSFANIIHHEAAMAAQESLSGNWVLGSETATTTNPELANSLVQQMQNTYVSNYVDVWENLLANIRLAKPTTLSQTDNMISHLISNESPLLQLLNTLHDNTFFEPVLTSSAKLQSLNLLVDKSDPDNNTLYQIFNGLHALHKYLHNILTAEDEKKAAFDAIHLRMQNIGKQGDIITELRLIADKSPEPVKTWLDKITNDAWHFLLQDATRYLDTSWKTQVSQPYQANIANHYPFNANATQEASISKFTEFFGNPGTLLTFHHDYLQAFIDTSTPEWRWKTIDNHPLPFSDAMLAQLQMGMRIHHMFFPNGDNKLYVQFALQPYQLSKTIQSVKLHINDKKIVDKHEGSHTSHILSWPNKYDTKMTSIQLTGLNKEITSRDFPGEWGWFKLVNESIVSTLSQKTLVINLSEDKRSAKYLLFTSGQLNPFLSLNLQNFHLPSQLIEKKPYVEIAKN